MKKKGTSELGAAGRWTCWRKGGTCHLFPLAQRRRSLNSIVPVTRTRPAFFGNRKIRRRVARKVGELERKGFGNLAGGLSYHMGEASRPIPGRMNDPPSQIGIPDQLDGAPCSAFSESREGESFARELLAERRRGGDVIS